MESLDNLEPMSYTNSQQNPQDRVQNYIDTTTILALQGLLSPNGQPSVTIRRRPKKNLFFINPSNGALEANEIGPSATYTWPGKDAYEAWKFSTETTRHFAFNELTAAAVIIQILAAISEAMHSGLVISKRLDIYYNDPECFGSQRVVDTVVDDIARTIGVNRLALNVEGAAKGLMTGCYCLKTKSHGVIDARLSTTDTLIPRLEDIDAIDISNAEWVLILEKEAVFRRLARTSYHTRAAAGKGILITGKGYPDVNTRAFVRRLHDSTSPLQTMPQFYALVDSDPDGIAIMSTYKYGSMAHAHENGKLNVPGLRWLGLRISDVVRGMDPQGDDAFIRLTARDRKKALAMLRNNPACAADGPEKEWCAELQQMLMLNLKAETEILYDRNGGLEAWIDQKLAEIP